MSNKLMLNTYNGITDLENALSGDSTAYAFRIPVKVVSVKPKTISKEGARTLSAKEKKVLRLYRRIIFVMSLFALFSLYNVFTAKFMDRLGASMLFIMSVLGVFAFYDDKERWRKRSEA